MALDNLTDEQKLAFIQKYGNNPSINNAMKSMTQSPEFIQPKAPPAPADDSLMGTVKSGLGQSYDAILGALPESPNIYNDIEGTGSTTTQPPSSPQPMEAPRQLADAPAPSPMGTGGLKDLPRFPSVPMKDQPQIPLKDEIPSESQEQSEEQEPAPKQSPAAPQKMAAPQGNSSPLPKTQDLATLLAQDKSGGSYTDAVKARDYAQLINQMGSAGDIIGGALARTGPNAQAQEAFKQNIALANQGPKDFQEKIAMESHDPNSAESKNYREFLKRYGINVGEGVTASQIKDTLMPALEKEQMQKERLQAAKDNKQIQLQYMQQLKQHNEDLQKQKNVDSMNQKVGQQLESIRGNKAIQNDLETIRRTKNFTETANLYPDKDKIPADVLSRLNQDMGVIFSGGVAGTGILKEGANPTIAKQLAQGLSYLNNHPTGANAKAFVQQNQAIINQLSKSAEGRVSDMYRRKLNTLATNLPYEMKENYRSQYLPTHTLNEKGQFIPPEEQEAPSKSQESNTKTIGDKTYIKVPGGWQEQ